MSIVKQRRIWAAPRPKSQLIHDYIGGEAVAYAMIGVSNLNIAIQTAESTLTNWLNKYA